nr:transposase, Ptta/En/Spm [Tanacetum cinerariifolium]GEY65760.1 transposase, Ptta/En/Spm [Tanacetum cinerariifolium]
MTDRPSTTRCTGVPFLGSKDAQEEMKVGLKKEIKNELKEEMREDLQEETRKEFKEEIYAKIEDVLVEYGIKSHVACQPKTKHGKASGCTC